MTTAIVSFALFALLVTMVPGPDTLLVLRNCMRGGRFSGITTAMGAAVGSLAWAVAASVGLAAVLQRWDAAFMVVRLADAAYLVEEAFPQHPDADVIFSFPGLGVQLDARVLAEIGDDRQRFADARGLKAYAGSSPITRASGKKSSITRRWVKNDRLNHAGYLWAFPRSLPHPAPRPTTAGGAMTTETGMPPHSATCSTA